MTGKWKKQKIDWTLLIYWTLLHCWGTSCEITKQAIKLTRSVLRPSTLHSNDSMNPQTTHFKKKNRLCFEMSLSMIPDCSKGHCFSTTKKTWLRFEMSLGEIQEHSSQMFCSKSWVRSDPLNWNIRWYNVLFSKAYIQFLKNHDRDVTECDLSPTNIQLCG